MRALTTARRRPARRAGFSAIELLVSFTVMAIVVGGVLVLFGVNNRVAKVQTHVAEMQQSLRVAQYDMVRVLRMAGRGGLGRGAVPAGMALAVRNDVPDAGDLHHIAVGDTASPAVVPGSDVVTARGVFTTPLYQVDPTGGNLTLDDPVNPTTGTIRIQDPSPNTSVPQDLRPLAAAIRRGLPEALLLVSALSDEVHAVVELVPASSSITDDAQGVPRDVTAGFRISGGTYTDGYQAISPGGGFPPGLRSVALFGILEEYRFYVRENDPNPRFSRARVYPGSEAAHGGDPDNLQQDIADSVLDLQAALGIDLDRDDAVVENLDNLAADEWLFNGAGDDPDASQWNAGVTPPPLFYLRVTTLARTARPDPTYRSPALARLEDHLYNETDPVADDDERLARQFRRRQLQTVVDLRNL